MQDRTLYRGCVVALTAALGTSALAQSPHATVGLDLSEQYFTPGTVVTVVVSLNYDGLPPDALGLAGWNIAVDFADGIEVLGATYVTVARPLIEQNDPFFGDPAPDINGNTVNFTEGLNALGGPTSDYHTGGALATITVDTTNYHGFLILGDFFARSRMGDSPLGAFTYATPSPNFHFAFVGTDFSDGTYATVPASGSAAAFGLGGLFAARRRRGELR